MLEVENMSPFLRAFHIDLPSGGKEFIFKAREIRIVPDYFLNPNGSLKYAGLLKLRRIINENGESTRPYIRRDENYVNPNQSWEYVFVNPEGQEFITTKVNEFCENNGLNPTSIRKYIELNKVYKGWKISKRKFVEAENKEDD